MGKGSAAVDASAPRPLAPAAEETAPLCETARARNLPHSENEGLLDRLTALLVAGQQSPYLADPRCAHPIAMSL